MSFERARSREHKEERREEIMKAGAELLETMDYEKITLAAIADKLSFTRANLYKYVSSRDEIFLWILLGIFPFGLMMSAAPWRAGSLGKSGLSPPSGRR